MKNYSKKMFSSVVLCSTIVSMLHAEYNGSVIPFIQLRSEGRDTARKVYNETTYPFRHIDKNILHHITHHHLRQKNYPHPLVNNPKQLHDNPKKPHIVEKDIITRNIAEPHETEHDITEKTYIHHTEHNPHQPRPNRPALNRHIAQEKTYRTHRREEIVENRLSGMGNITVQYDHSFNGKELADALFGNSLTSNFATLAHNNNHHRGDKVLVIQGSEVATTKLPMSWMAENLGLARDFQSAISFSPEVQNVVVNFDFLMGLDRWVDGMYFRAYGPLNWNQASLRPEEIVITPGTIGYAPGFVAATAVLTTHLFTKALQFFDGGQLPAAPGETIDPLRFAKFADACGNASRHALGFAELRGELGWNYIRERGRFLINLQAAAPTGTRPNGEYLFPAQVGNGKHWELGVGLGGAWRMWCDESEEKSFNFIVEADITHLFNAKQKRTFDLIGKPNSRYMLAQHVVANKDLAPGKQLENGEFQFDGRYAPVANFSTRDVKVSIGVQGDVAAMLNYTVRGFSCDLGYNFWGMSCSKIKLYDNCNDICGTAPFLDNTWALKGDASTVGVYGDGVSTPVNLGATQSTATIFSGAGADANNSNPSNTGIDSPIDAMVVVNGGTAVNAFGGGAISTSNTPLFLSIKDLDIEGAQQRGLSHKVFTYFNYTWVDHERWTPSVGAGFSAQFGSHSNNNNDNCSVKTITNSCNSNGCGSIALSNWALFVKGGVSFH